MALYHPKHRCPEVVGVGLAGVRDVELVLLVHVTAASPNATAASSGGTARRADGGRTSLAGPYPSFRGRVAKYRMGPYIRRYK